MKPQDIIKAIAELDGRLETAIKIIHAWSGNERGMLLALHAQKLDYLTSRDAIVPVIEKQAEDVKKRFFVFLMGDAVGTLYPQLIRLVLATPPKLCEDLLRATGRWVE